MDSFRSPCPRARLDFWSRVGHELRRSGDLSGNHPTARGRLQHQGYPQSRKHFRGTVRDSEAIRPLRSMARDASHLCSLRGPVALRHRPLAVRARIRRALVCASQGSLDLSERCPSLLEPSVEDHLAAGYSVRPTVYRAVPHTYERDLELREGGRLHRVRRAMLQAGGH